MSLPCPGLDDASKVSESWLSLEAKYKEQLLQKKLKVNFVVDDDERDESQINDTTYANATQSAPLGAPLAAAGAALGLTSEKPAEQPIDNANANGSARDTTVDVADEADAELEQSKARISTLSEKLDSNEAGQETKAVSASDEAVSGVSLPYAVILVLIALLLGWYIF